LYNSAQLPAQALPRAQRALPQHRRHFSLRVASAHRKQRRGGKRSAYCANIGGCAGHHAVVIQRTHDRCASRRGAPQLGWHWPAFAVNVWQPLQR